MSICDDVMEVGRRTNFPVKWCQIFAKVLMKVAERLGVKLEVYPFRNDCIFVSIEAGTISIQPPIDYSQASSDNLNITGWDYNGPEPPDELTFLTEVGYRNRWYNEHLFPKLLRNKKLRDAIVDHYSPCEFIRFIRINKIRQFVYQWIENYPGTYQGFEDYLKAVINSGIYYSEMTPDECIDNLKDLGVPSERCDEIRATLNHESYNWLEYLKIITPPLKFKLILACDPAELAKFEKQIWIHITGMILIDQIYQCQENAREIDKMLNTFATWLKAHSCP